MKLKYQKGTLVLEGDYNVPYAKWDDRSKCYRAQALYYKEIIEYLEASDISYEDNVLDLIPCPDLFSNIKLRGYQQKAMEKWLKEKKEQEKKD